MATGNDKPLTVQELAAMGGRARADSLTPKRRREIAQKAIEARWAKADARKRKGKK